MRLKTTTKMIIDVHQLSRFYHVNYMINELLVVCVYRSSTGSWWFCTGSGIWCGCSATFKIHFSRWKVTGEEHDGILGIYILRYLNDTLSTSPFGQKENIDILCIYIYIDTWPMSLAPMIGESALLMEK